MFKSVGGLLRIGSETHPSVLTIETRKVQRNNDADNKVLKLFGLLTKVNIKEAADERPVF